MSDLYSYCKYRISSLSGHKYIYSVYTVHQSSHKNIHKSKIQKFSPFKYKLHTNGQVQPGAQSCIFRVTLSCWICLQALFIFIPLILLLFLTSGTLQRAASDCLLYLRPLSCGATENTQDTILCNKDPRSFSHQSLMAFYIVKSVLNLYSGNRL